MGIKLDSSVGSIYRAHQPKELSFLKEAGSPYCSGDTCGGIKGGSYNSSDGTRNKKERQKWKKEPSGLGGLIKYWNEGENLVGVGTNV